ncbi:MAG TPA: FAD-dependent oxidoreductase [Candidatus Acidoferrales bacterium]|nr:FAD-dependent oxidoreductase [Candidatus Acidoferrales bacterium]
MPNSKSPDVAVIGSGVFGAWIAYFLGKSGVSVLLLDAYGPGNARASSGGESRIIRMGYGADEIYTRWSRRALPLWKSLFAEAGRPELFLQTGVLWIAHEQYQYALDTLAALQEHKIPHERLSLLGLRKHYPQITFDEDAWGIFEPESGVLLARRAVQSVVEQARKIGVEYRGAAVLAPGDATAKITSLKTTTGETISANTFVFACGPWLGKIFPQVLVDRIFPSRQEIFFFGLPSGDTRFTQPALPTWLYLKDEFYGMPDLESRGFKVADDRHGPRVDPDTQSRIASTEALDAARKFVARRFPTLKNAPVVETRVCQYENTSNGDFLIDRHPEFDNVWLVGGGSGHGFKHGPSLGEYVAARVTETQAAKNESEPRFSLATKQTIQNRAVH